MRAILALNPCIFKAPAVNPKYVMYITKLQG